MLQDAVDAVSIFLNALDEILCLQQLNDQKKESRVFRHPIDHEKKSKKSDYETHFLRI